MSRCHNLLGSIYHKQRKYDTWLAETVRERDSMGVKPETTAALLTAYHSAGLPGHWREELKQAKFKEQSGLCFADAHGPNLYENWAK